jgi:hypothetical protein
MDPHSNLQLAELLGIHAQSLNEELKFTPGIRAEDSTFCVATCHSPAKQKTRGRLRALTPTLEPHPQHRHWPCTKALIGIGQLPRPGQGTCAIPTHLCSPRTFSNSALRVLCPRKPSIPGNQENSPFISYGCCFKVSKPRA